MFGQFISMGAMHKHQLNAPVNRWRLLYGRYKPISFNHLIKRYRSAPRPQFCPVSALNGFSTFSCISNVFPARLDSLPFMPHLLFNFAGGGQRLIDDKLKHHHHHHRPSCGTRRRVTTQARRAQWHLINEQLIKS